MEILINSASCIKNNNVIFDNLNIVLGESDIWLITGPNGCGKNNAYESWHVRIQNLESGSILMDKIDIQNPKADSRKKLFI